MPVPGPSPIPILQHLAMALERQLAQLAPDDPLRPTLQAALDAVVARLAEGS